MKDEKDNRLELLEEENKLLKSQVALLDKEYKKLMIDKLEYEKKFNSDKFIYLEITNKRLMNRIKFTENIAHKIQVMSKYKKRLNFKNKFSDILKKAFGKSASYDYKTMIEKLCIMETEQEIISFEPLNGYCKKDLANIYTNVAKNLWSKNKKLSIKLAERAWMVDPQIYRLKWWAFRAYDAGLIKIADFLIDNIPKEEFKKEAEKTKAKKIKDIAWQKYKTEFFRSKNIDMEKYILNSFYNNQLKKKYDELKKNYEILLNEKSIRDNNYTSLEEALSKLSKEIDIIWDNAKIENLCDVIQDKTIK